MPTITIQIGNQTYEAELYEGKGPETFYNSLPEEIRMSRWGDEFYGSCSAPIKEDSTLRDLYEVGEIAFWPPGNAFCIFFGPTPASSDSRPRMASPGVPLGKIKGDATGLRKLGSSVKAVIQKKE
ncbi:MAG: cyclophilin-like fold protein [Spirochaetales bacterium]